MTTDVQQACADLKAWLPYAADLIDEPDTQPSAGRTKPGSKPPWNNHAATVIHETIGILADIHLEMAHAVHGRYTWDPAYRHVGRTLIAITRLAPACDEELVHQAVIAINGRTTAIMQLPAIDLEEPPRRIPAHICPQCDRGMVWVRPRSGSVACIGCRLQGHVMPGTVSDGYIQWEDGTIT